MVNPNGDLGHNPSAKGCVWSPSQAFIPQVIAANVSQCVRENQEPQRPKEAKPMTDWDSFSKEVKNSVWGTQELPAHDPNPLWHAKYSGEVIHHPRTIGEAAYDEYLINPGFSTAKFIENRWAGIPKTSTAQCRTVTHPRPKT